MRLVMRSLGLIAGLLFLVVGLELIASESGEVVVLVTTDESGQPHETRLWVVDEGLRAGETVVVKGLQQVRSGTKVTPTVEPLPSAGT